MFGRVLYVESKQGFCNSLLFIVQYGYIAICNTKRYMFNKKTVYFIILEHIPMYALVSEVDVRIKVNLIARLSSSPG